MTMLRIGPESLGSAQFTKDYGLRYAYLGGAMYKGIASVDMVVALGKAGLMGYFGAGGVRLGEIDAAIQRIKGELNREQPFGMNLLCNMEQPEVENEVVDLYLRNDVRFVEAAAFVQITPGIVRYRLSGISAGSDGRIHVPRRILAKVSRPEVAAAFMRPAPDGILRQLVERGLLTEREAYLGQNVPLAQDICVEADSGGHTDQGVAYTLVPTILALRDEIQKERGYAKPIWVGTAGGIGAPHAAAAAFAMGADFILTGSINQCTVEAGTSDVVKDLLQTLNVQDTAYAPAGDMFELGAKVQVVRRGVFFPGRANRLYEIYRRHDSLDEIDANTRKQLEEKYFRRTFEQVWQETVGYYAKANPKRIEEAERNPRQKMSLVFRWYFVHSSRVARVGDESMRVDYQIQCGPAMGAFNQWVKGTTLESWRRRHVADIGLRLIQGAAGVLQNNVNAMLSSGASGDYSGRTVRA